MSKLDVGVGDEFPTEEIRRDSDGVVHHHHYYYRRRRFGLLRIVLIVALISFLFRAIDYAFNPPGWGPRGFWHNSFFPFGGATVLVLVIAALLWRGYERDRDY